MTPPKTLTCISDSNILVFTQIIKSKTEVSYEYRYTKSFTKEGKTVMFSETQLMKNLKNKIFE